MAFLICPQCDRTSPVTEAHEALRSGALVKPCVCGVTMAYCALSPEKVTDTEVWRRIRTLEQKARKRAETCYGDAVQLNGRIRGMEEAHATCRADQDRRISELEGDSLVRNLCDENIPAIPYVEGISTDEAVSESHVKAHAESKERLVVLDRRVDLLCERLGALGRRIGCVEGDFRSVWATQRERDEAHRRLEEKQVATDGALKAHTGD